MRQKDVRMERVPTVSGTTNLVDILDRVLDKGLVIAGDVRVSLANVELLTIRIRLLVCSVDKAEQIGLNWWKYDPHLTMQAPVVPALAEKAPPSPRRAPGAKATRVRRPRWRGEKLGGDFHMAVERVSGGSSLIDVLDRVLDKGIVIDAWVRISLVGIDLITVEARVVVASIDTYLKYADAVGLTGLVSRPQLTGEELPEVEIETTRRVARTPVRRAARKG
jgi:hypothetical protein